MSASLLSCVTTEGGLLPPELLQRVLSQDRGLPGLSAADYHIDVRLGEAASRAWTSLQAAWRAFRTQLEKLPVDDTGTTVTRERWLLPLFRELGFGWLTPRSGHFSVDAETYPFSHGYGHVPMHLLGARVSLDKKERGLAGAARMSPHGLIQQFLNRSDAHLWGIVSNGLTLRLLRDHYSLSTAAYVEFDLESMFDGGLYSEFFLLFLVLHQSRFEAEKPSDSWIEGWFREAQKDGVAALDRLGSGAKEALVQFGTGFLVHPDNGALRLALKQGRLGRDGYFRELLRILYRVLFLFVAEDRQALLLPDAPTEQKSRFTRYYGTRQLRERAFLVKGAAHHDLWEQLRVVFAGLWEGEPALALPALGSGLFDPRQLPCLTDARLSNAHLLAAVRALAEVTEGGRRIRVSYRNLGAQELGSVYESLLELHPALNVDAGSFELSLAAGHERKTTGSYYTPVSLVESLLDTALDPVLDAAVVGKTARHAQAAILDVKVCDPACGSGHFLVAAARRIADRLARVRTPDEEPSPAQRQHALRDVVGHCIFGVDMNAMAVELCKVSLWMEGIEPGRPLSFLDAHIQCGNALFGAEPWSIAGGIPDEAFDPIAGDDKKIAAIIRKQNKKERNELTLDFSKAPESIYRRIGESARAMDGASDDNLIEVRRKQQSWEELVRSEGFERARFIADLWCAAFVWMKEEGRMREFAPTEAVFRAIQENADRAPPALRAEVRRLRDVYNFFHWHLAFPQVLAPAAAIPGAPPAYVGGFDVIIGNPPWDRVTVQEKEWFASRVPEVANARTAAARRKAIAALQLSSPDVFSAFRIERRRVDAEKAFIGRSGRYPLSAQGILNTYPLFVETSLKLLAKHGRCGLIVPTGIATAEGTGDLLRHMLDRGLLRSLLDLHNRRGIFPEVQRNMRFSLLTASGSGDVDMVVAAHMSDLDELKDESRRCHLTDTDIATVNPETRHLPLFASRADATLVLSLYRNNSYIARELSSENGMRCEFLRMLNTGDDSDEFLPLDPELFRDANAASWLPSKHAGSRLFPLYEAKLLEQYNHRAATFVGTNPQRRYGMHAAANAVPRQQLDDPKTVSVPRYWVPESLLPIDLFAPHLAVYRNAVSAVADARSLAATIVPWGGVGDSLKVARCAGRFGTALITSALNSFVVDYVFRQKASGSNASAFILRQLPIPTLSKLFGPCTWDSSATLIDWLTARVLELTYTAYDLASFARECGYDGPPFRWSDDRRQLLRAEIDGAYFIAFGLSRIDVVQILERFPIVHRLDHEEFGEERTKRLVLECYDAMTQAAATATRYRTRLIPPPVDVSLTDRADVADTSFKLARVPDAAWARPRSELTYETLAAIAAILKALGAPAPIRDLRLAATLVLEPRWLVPHLDPDAGREWCRLVGPEGAPLQDGVTPLVPTADASWGGAVRQMRGSGRLIEDLASGTWAPGRGLDRIETGGWPDGRASFVLEAVGRIGAETLIGALPEEIRRSINAAAA